jgi:CBS domain-containing protein
MINLNLRDKVSRYADPAVKLIEEGRTIEEAASLMEALGVGSLAVVDSSMRLVGVISERDIVRAVAKRDYKAKVKDYMRPNTEVVEEEETIEDVLERVAESGVRTLPVVDRQGRLKGTISVSEILSGASDYHFRLYGKPASEFRSSGMICPVCGVEIDELGFCACGAGGA